MSLEENKAIVHRFIEALNSKDLDSLDDLIAPNYVDMQLQGRESAKEFMKMLYRGFPDFHVTIDDIVAEGDKVWFRIKATGTHIGDFHGFPPTGKKMTITAVDIFRIAHGKAVQGWDVNDYLNFYEQLGVIEYTEKGKKLFPKDVS